MVSHHWLKLFYKLLLQTIPLAQLLLNQNHLSSRYNNITFSSKLYVRRRLAGFRSLCKTPFLCMKSTASISWYRIFVICESERFGVPCINWCKSPSNKSITMYISSSGGFKYTSFSEIIYLEINLLRLDAFLSVSLILFLSMCVLHHNHLMTLVKFFL